MTVIPPGHTAQDLRNTPAGYNPYAQALNDLSGDQVDRSMRMQGQRTLQNAMTSDSQQRANMLALAKKAEIIGGSGRGEAMKAIAGAVMPVAQQSGIPAQAIINDWIGRGR